MEFSGKQTKIEAIWRKIETMKVKNSNVFSVVVTFSGGSKKETWSSFEKKKSLPTKTDQKFQREED